MASPYSMRTPAGLGILAFMLAAPSDAAAATIAKACVASANWSATSSWTGGVVPGVSDIGAETGPNAGSCGLAQTITVDSAAANTLGSWIGGQLHNAGQNAGGVSVALGRDATFSGSVYIREGNLADNGYDLTVNGTLSNCGSTTCSYLNGEGNGLVLVRTGGNITATTARFQRATSASFRPGDSIGTLNLECLSQRNSCPAISVTQDPAYYAGVSEQGLTIATALVIGSLSATVESKITLNWNTSGLSGARDWTLRVRGNAVTQLRTAYTNGQLLIGTLPAGQVFDSTAHIVYNSADNYTYVGFVGDSDGDGVSDGLDICPDGDDTLDYDVDGVPDDCDLCPDDSFNDADLDEVCGDVDNCPTNTNTNQIDSDGDAVGDACDVCMGDDASGNLDGDDYCDNVDEFPEDPAYYNDDDNDGVPDQLDKCPDYDDSLNSDLDQYPDDCDICPVDDENDADLDGYCESEDNCQDVANEDQTDIDGDGLGDACDDDVDGDTVANGEDCAPTNADASEEFAWYLDSDVDGFGDAGFVTMVCESSADPVGYVLDNLDCNDGAFDISPEADEVCDPDDVDENCDGVSDNNDPNVIGTSSWYADADGDGLGAGLAVSDCDQPEGYVSNSSDLCASDNPASGRDLDHDGCTDVPTVSGFTTTTNADGSYALTTGSGGSAMSVTLPAGTTTSAASSISTSVDAYGNTVVLFSGITLPAGTTKTAVLRLPGSKIFTTKDYYEGRNLVVRVVEAKASHCVIDSSAPLAYPTKTGCTGILWSAATNTNLTPYGQNVNKFSGIYRKHPYGTFAGKTVAGYAIPLGERKAPWAGGGSVSYELATTPTTVTLTAKRGTKLTDKYYPVTYGIYTFSDLSHTGIVAYADDDGDGLPNADELLEYGTDPAIADSDDDGVPDGMEVEMATSPLDATDVANPDEDGDGILYDQEVLMGTNPALADSDGDGVSDTDELADETDPLDAASSAYSDLDGNGVDDRHDDDDGDGVENGAEESYGTDPDEADTDSDGIDDYAELFVYETDPLDAYDVLAVDSDGDGLDDHDDNCILIDNPGQANADGDQAGDDCDDDDDNDGAFDDEEVCSLDPGKTDAGDCGCGSPDLDSDVDGVTDCLEEVLTIDGRRSHIYFENGIGVYAAFHGVLALNGGLLAPDLRDGATGIGQIGVTLEGNDAYSNDSVMYEVADGASSVDNKERWAWKESNDERASVRWKDSEKYMSTRDEAFPALNDTNNLGRLVSRFIHTDETRLRFRWTNRTQLPLTVAVDGVPLITVAADTADTCVDGEVTASGAVLTCLDGYSVASTYQTHEVYRDDDGERKRVVDVDFTGDRLGDGNVIAWYADGNADDGLTNLVYSQVALDDGTGTSVWYNAGGRFDITVPIGGFAEPLVSCPSAELSLQFGGANTTATIEGSAEWTGYDVEKKSQKSTKKVNGQHVTSTKSWTHWRAKEVGEDCALDDDTCDED